MTKLWLITGKGGVGKTRITHQTALSNPAFHPLGDEEISRSLLAEDFLKRALKFKALAHFLGQSRLLQTLMDLAPNLHEILYLHELIQRSKQKGQLVDAPSTGNFIALFEALLTAQELFESGLLRNLVEESLAFLRTPGFVKVTIVSLPELSALSEAREIDTYLKSKWPEFEREFAINRLHHRSSHPEKWLEPWKSLATRRVDREIERLQNFEAQCGPIQKRFYEEGLSA